MSDQAPPQAGAPLLGENGWAPAPEMERPSNCPPGLEYLLYVDQLLVKQQVELLEAFTAFETSNKYKVLNSMGQQVYFAGEKSGCCGRQFCGSIRDFEMVIADNAGKEVAKFIRPFNCTIRCCLSYLPCQLQEMEINAGGQTVGKIKQRADCTDPVFAICDASGEEVLKVKGPACVISCCGDIDFEVLTKDGQKIGKVSKQWSGLVKEGLTDADNFGVSFPMDLDVRVKLSLMAVVFLIDFMFFENNEPNEDGCCSIEDCLFD